MVYLCLILTLEYYKARLHTIYQKLIPTAMAAYLAFLAFALIIQKW